MGAKITNIVSKISSTNSRKRWSHKPSIPFTIMYFNKRTKYAHSLLVTNPISFSTKVSPDKLLFFVRQYRVYHLFDEMHNRNKSWEIFHYYDVIDIIKLSTIRPHVVSAMSVHSLALKVGALASLPCSTSMLISYSKAGDFRSSVALFNEISHRDVVVWNAIMTAAVENRCYGDAMSFFVQMIKEGNGFDSATLVIVVSLVSNMKKLVLGRVIHGLSVKCGMLWDPFLCNSLINMYAKCGDLSSSEFVFSRQDCRDIISWNSLICGCLYNHQPEKSLSYFRKMCSFEKLADNVNLSSAITACTSLGDLDAGEVLHGWGVKLGFEERSHVSVANSLISFYAECGQINAAVTMFRGLVCKDVVSWNSMIHGLASNGLVTEAFGCLYQMQSEGFVQPDIVTMLIILPLCAELALSIEGKIIHGFIIRREIMGSDLSIVNSLLDMYMKNNRVKVAEHLFQVMPERDLVTWNTMISGYSNYGYSRGAHTLFKKLLSWCWKCSLSTVLGILPSCNSPESLDLGKLIHGWQLKLGFQNNILVLNSLMFMYTNCGDLKACLLLLSRFCGILDTGCWNAVISGCIQNSFYPDALNIFNLMRKESYVTHDSITLVSVISACGNLELVLEGKLTHGLSFKTLEGADIRVQNSLITMYGKFGDIKSAKLVFDFCCHRNLCSWNCMISTLSQNKQASEALELFHCLDLDPNEITTATILSACTQLGLIQYGKEIHGRVYRVQFHTNSFITASLVDTYSNCGRLETAVKVFQHSPNMSVEAWNPMISAHGFHGNGHAAIESFNKMIVSGISPTNATFVSLLSACSHVGLVDEGLWYYDCMEDEYGVKPVIEHHVCVVNLLGRAGRLDDAYNFIKWMPNQAEPGLWGALLSACNYHGNVEMGREVANVLFSLDSENAGYYISLSNMYVAAGGWGDAVKLRELMQDKQLKKQAGYTINIDSSVVGLGL